MAPADEVTEHSPARDTVAIAAAQRLRVQAGSSRLRAVATVALVAAGGWLLVRALAGLDWRRAIAAVVDIGWAGPLVLLPFVAAVSLDSVATRRLLAALGRPAPLGALLRIRTATEALHVTSPAGFLVSDGAAAALLESRCRVPLGDGAVLAVARKWLVMRAHAAYILLGAGLGAGALARATQGHAEARFVAAVLVATALVPLGLSLAVGAGFRGHGVLARLHDALACSRIATVRRVAASFRSGASAIDDRMTRLGAAQATTWAATGAFFGCWLCEAFETALVLRLVGGRLDLGAALGIEVGVSMLRSMGNVAPAGLGIQDAGYATLLAASGAGSEVAAAFVVVKRCKELVWIAAGYALLAWMRRPVRLARRRRRVCDAAAPPVSRAAPRGWARSGS